MKDLHKKMFGDVWKWAGHFRKSDRNIGIKWTQIGIELKNLLDDTKFWTLFSGKKYFPGINQIRIKQMKQGKNTLLL